MTASWFVLSAMARIRLTSTSRSNRIAKRYAGLNFPLKMYASILLMSQLRSLIKDSINSGDEQDRIQAPMTMSHMVLDSALELDERTCELGVTELRMQFNNWINFSIT